jgi:hypothetical protein
MEVEGDTYSSSSSSSSLRMDRSYKLSGLVLEEGGGVEALARLGAMGAASQEDPPSLTASTVVFLVEVRRTRCC